MLQQSQYTVYHNIICDIHTSPSYAAKSCFPMFIFQVVVSYSIGQGTFEGCVNLQSMAIPTGVISIGSMLFQTARHYPTYHYQRVWCPSETVRCCAAIV